MFPPKLRMACGFAVPIVSVLLIVVWTLGQILRDRTWWTALLFYFPTPVLVTWLLFALATLKTRRRLHLFLLITPLVMMLWVENQWVHPVQQSRIVVDSRVYSKRLIHWNVGRGAMGWDKQWRYIKSLNPDIVVISEIPDPFDPATMQGFDALEFHAKSVHGMAVICHGSMTTSRTLIRGGALNAYHVTCQLDEGAFELMVADMTSHVTVPRDPYLRSFATLLAERQIDISVGDFNAPRRSMAFGELPLGFQHSYSAAGAGWSYTWPVPVPCLAIDQCITGPRVRPIHYELRSTMLSDHRLQILDFEWQP